MMNLVSRYSARTPDVLPPIASESLGKTRHESQFPRARKLSSIIERGDPLKTLTHQASQNGTLIKLGLLKIGNLMN